MTIYIWMPFHPIISAAITFYIFYVVGRAAWRALPFT